jgi:hypothetical protein
MGKIQVPGRLSGRTYTVDIAGDTPTEAERARIVAGVQEREARFAQRYEAELGKPLAAPEDGTALGRGIARGIPQLKSTLGTTIETAGQQFGLPSIAEYGRGMEEAAAQRLFELQLEQPAPTRAADITGLGSALTYLGEIAGEQAPQLGAGLAGGAAGAVAGGIAAGPGGALAGFGVGSGLIEAPMLFGANVQRQEEEVAAGRKEAVDLTDALGATVGQASLTAVTNALAGAGVFLRPGATLFTRIGSGAAVGGTTEGLNEVGQQVLERFQAGLPVDSPDAIKEYIEAGVAGGVLGVAAGGVGGIAGPSVREPAPAAVPPEEAPAVAGLLAPPVQIAGALPAPGTLEPISAARAPGTVVTPAPQGAVSGAPTANVPPLSPEADATARSIGSDPQLLSAVKAIEDSGKATVQILQDALGLSYPAAQGVMKKLENIGAVSKYSVGKDRKLTLPFKISAIQAPAAPTPKAEEVNPPTVKLPEAKPAVVKAAEVVPESTTSVAETDVSKNVTPPPAEMVDTAPAEVKAAVEAAPPVAAVPVVTETLSASKKPRAKKKEAANVPQIEEAQSGAMGVGPVSGEQRVGDGGQPAGDIQPAGKPEAPKAGGLGGDMSGAVGTPTAEGLQPTALIDAPKLFDDLVSGRRQSITPEEAIAFPDQLLVDEPSPTPTGDNAAARSKLLREYSARQDARRKIRSVKNIALAEREGEALRASMPRSPTLDMIANAIGVGRTVGAAGQLIPPAIPPAQVVSPAPAVSTGPMRFTGAPTEIQVRDAERALAEMQRFRAQADNVAAQSELDAAWNERFKDKPELAAMVEDVATPDRVVAEDPTTAEDKRKILALFKRGAVKTGKAGQSGAGNARNYFSKFKRPIDAIEWIVADARLPNMQFDTEEGIDAEIKFAGDENISAAERELFAGTSRRRARSALEWVYNNLSPQAQLAARNLSRKYRRSAEAVIPVRAESALSASTAIGRRAATAEERVAFEAELRAAAEQKALDRAANRKLAEAAGSGLDALNDLAAGTRSITRRAVPSRKLTSDDQVDFLVEHIFGLRNGPLARLTDVSDVNLPLHPGVVRALRANDLPSALRLLRQTAPNARIQKLAVALEAYGARLNLSVQENLEDAYGRSALGLYDPPTRTLYLDNSNGMTVDTLLHELVHAATANELRRPGSQLAAKIGKLYVATRPLLDGTNGATSLDEFVAEALSNPLFQQKLASIHPDGKRFSALERFMEAVRSFLRQRMGFPIKSIESALDVADQIINQIIVADRDNPTPGALYQLNTPEGAKATMNALAKLSGSFPEATKEFRQEFGDQASATLTTLGGFAKRSLLGFMGMQPLSDIAGAVGVKGALDLQDAVRQMDSASIKSDEEVDGVLKVMTDWLNTHGAKKASFDKVVNTSTLEQVFPGQTREAAQKKYGNDPRKMQAYDAMQKDWAAIGPEGQQLYNLMRQLYRKQYERLREALAGKVDFALSSNPTLAAEVKKSIYEKFFDLNKIEPYFPLARTGDFWLEYSAFDPRTNTTEPVKEAFESPRARDRAMKELETLPGIAKDKTGKPIFNTYTSLDVVTRGRTPDSLFVKDTLNIIRANLAQQGVSSDISNNIQQEITRMFVEALPETSFARSLQRRKGTAGFITDPFEAFRLKAYSLGRQGVRYAYSNKIRAIRDDITEQAQGSDDANKVAVIQELAARADFATNPPTGLVEQAVQAVNRTAFTFTIGFNVSSALVNLASIPVLVAPYLSGRYGIGGTTRQLSNAYKLFLNSGLSREVELPTSYMGKKTTEVRATPSIDNYFVLNEKNEYVLRDGTPEALRAELADLGILVDVAAKNGQLNRSMFYDSIGAEEVGRSRGLADKFAAYSGFLFHNVERANRQVALVAAYKLELDRMRRRPTRAERGLSDTEMQRRAAESAVYQVTETSGGSTLATAPRWAQQGIGRVALMFKNYGLSIFYLQMKLAKQVVFGSSDPEFTPEMRQQAFKQLVGIQLSALALAGVSGVPLFGAASMIADMFLDEDEESAEMLARRYLGEGLYKGFLTDTLGVDISSRIGLTGLLIRENRYNTSPSAEESLVTTLGGPAWSTATKVGRGVSEFASAMTGGDTEAMVRGIENMLPVAIGNFVKAGRFAAEGGAIDTRRGDVITGDLTAFDLAGQVVGFKPNEASLQQDLNLQNVRISKAVAEKRAKLSRAYYIAMRVGDVEGMQDALEDIRSFNEDVGSRFPEAVIDGEFIKSSLKSHLRTTNEMDAGVYINPVVRQALRDLAGQYNQGVQIF